MYGKLINGEVEYAPKDYVLDDGKVIANFNRSIAKMREFGYIPVIDAKPGYNVDTQYCNFVGYVDNGRYIRAQYVIEDIEFSEAEIQNQEAQKAMGFLNIDLQEQVQTLSDEQALEVQSVFPVWQVGVDYVVDYKLRYNDILYKVLLEHHSQGDWTPEVAPSLFAKVLVGQDEEILDWVQPDATNGYMTGDKVKYNGVVYVSLIDNNVWSPEAYSAAWQIVE